MLIESALLAAVVLALVAVTGVTAVVGRVVLTRINELETPAPHPTATEEIAAMSTRFHAEIESLRFAIAEGIERTERAEKRVQKTVASSRKLLREAGIEHAPLEAEAAQLLERNAEGERGVELLPMPEGVVEPRKIRIPGASQELLRRIGAA